MNARHIMIRRTPYKDAGQFVRCSIEYPFVCRLARAQSRNAQVKGRLYAPNALKFVSPHINVRINVVDLHLHVSHRTET